MNPITLLHISLNFQGMYPLNTGGIAVRVENNLALGFKNKTQNVLNLKKLLCVSCDVTASPAS